MVDGEPKRSTPKQSDNGEKGALFSPGFRSVAAMVGWDEEALSMAYLVVEDTPDRNAKQKVLTSNSSSLQLAVKD